MACSIENGRRRIMPPTYFFASLLLVGGFCLALPGGVHPSAFDVAAGIALLGAGTWLNLASDSAFKRRSTPVAPDATPTTLVESGVFKVTRNPMYLGMVLIVAGVALLVGEPIALTIPAVLLWVLDRFFVPREEGNLESAFGAEYATYRSRVPRWI